MRDATVNMMIDGGRTTGVDGPYVGPRHAWRLAMVAREIGPSLPDGPVLDAGCGDGDLARWVTACAGVAVAADRDLSRVRAAANGARRAEGAGVRWSCADITRLPWPDASFAVAIAGEVLEHVADDARAARELYRVLRPGGRLIVTVPAGPRRFSPTDAAAGHVRRYDRAGLARLLIDAGLVDVRLRSWGWPFGRVYDRMCQRPALRVRAMALGRPVASLARASVVAGLWRALFAVDDRLDAGDRGSGLLAVARRGG